MFENNDAGIARDVSVGREKIRCVLPAQRHMNLRIQGEHVAFSRVLQSHCPSSGLRSAEIHTRVGGGVSTLLIEDQIPRLKVDGVF